MTRELRSDERRRADDLHLASARVAGAADAEGPASLAAEALGIEGLDDDPVQAGLQGDLQGEAAVRSREAD